METLPLLRSVDSEDNKVSRSPTQSTSRSLHDLYILYLRWSTSGGIIVILAIFLIVTFIVMFFGSIVGGMVVSDRKSNPVVSDSWFLGGILTALGSFALLIVCIACIFIHATRSLERLEEEVKKMTLIEQIRGLQPKTKCQIMSEIIQVAHPLAYRQLELSGQLATLYPVGGRFLSDDLYQTEVKNRLLREYISIQNDGPLYLDPPSRLSPQHCPRDILNLVHEYLRHTKPDPMVLVRRLELDEAIVGPIVSGLM